jgi:hypothetical protein
MGGRPMTEKQYKLKNKLINFLNKHDAFSSFEKNLIADGEFYCIDALVEKVVEYGIEESLIARGFTWADTKQGKDYWRFLSLIFRSEFNYISDEDATIESDIWEEDM